MKQVVRHKESELGVGKTEKLAGVSAGGFVSAFGASGYVPRKSKGMRLPGEVIKVLASKPPSRRTVLRKIKQRYLILTQAELGIAKIIWNKLPPEGFGELNLTALATEVNLLPSLLYRQVGALIGKHVFTAHGRGRYERKTKSVLVVQTEDNEKVYAEIDLETGSRISVIKPDAQRVAAVKEFSDTLLQSLGITGVFEDHAYES